MGSTTNNAFAKPAVLKNNSAVSSSTVRSSYPSSAFRPVKNDLLSANKVIVDKATNDINTTAGLSQPRGTHQELQRQHLSHHYDHHHHHHLAYGMQQQQQAPEHDEHCGSSNMPVEGNAGNYSVNGSASGSNHGSNGPNGSSPAVNTVGTNLDSDNGIAGKSGSGDASGSGSGGGSMAHQSKSAHREAALVKFLQKRKERCFQKKVQYQSRKRLSEQLPRIRGQFVRQSMNNNNNDPASEGNS